MESMEHSKLNPRQEVFLHKYLYEGKPGGVAYAEAYSRDLDGTAYTNASRLLRNAHIKNRVIDMRSMYIARAEEAYERQWAMIDDPTVPPQVKVNILSEFLNRAGL